jgi:hypothetical protein
MKREEFIEKLESPADAAALGILTIVLTKGCCKSGLLLGGGGGPWLKSATQFPACRDVTIKVDPPTLTVRPASHN